MTDSTHNIVVLGASYAGLKISHALLARLPGVASKTGKKYKVYLLANSTHFWWSVGAPRAMLKPYPKSNDDSFLPVASGFSKYSGDQFEFVHAEITAVNTAEREVSYKTKNDKEEIAQVTSKLHFDSLVITLGSTGPSPLYSLHGSHQPTLKAYEDVQARIPNAKSVIVIGGGSAGVETAGELGSMFGSKTSAPKDITLFSGADRLVTGLRADVGAKAEEMLTSSGVKVVHNVRLDDSKQLSDGTEQVKLSDGSTEQVDLLIIATGRRPASSVLPKDLLTDKGYVSVDEYLRIPSLESAYAAGDIASTSPGGVIHVHTQAPTAAQNLLTDLSAKGQKLKEWKPMTAKTSQIVPVGPAGGVGQLNGWWMPSIAVRFIKARNFMFPNAEKTVLGTA